MEAKDLRLDNIILYRDKIIKVNWQEIKWIQEYSNDLYKPIPLTEEILLKCGFESGYDTKLPYQKSYFLNGIILSEDFTLSYADEYMIQFGNPLIYLHQLQNLYFALTNEELTINL